METSLPDSCLLSVFMNTASTFVTARVVQTRCNNETAPIIEVLKGTRIGESDRFLPARMYSPEWLKSGVLFSGKPLNVGIFVCQNWHIAPNSVYRSACSRFCSSGGIDSFGRSLS